MSDCASKTFYSIVAPGVLRSNAVYNVATNLFDAIGTCEIKISLIGYEFNMDRVIKAHPWTTHLLSFEIPNLNYAKKYYLEAECIKGAHFKEKTQLLLEEGGPLVYIQCDKHAYKYKDDVEFRIIILEPNFLKPISETKSFKMHIKHSGKIVLEKSNLKLNKGIHTDKWRIPDNAAHGLYDIEVLYKNELIKSKSFKIIDLHPPKFNIKIHTAKKILYKQKQLFIGVETNSFNGDPIEGYCKMEIETIDGFFSGVCLEKVIPIKGKIEQTIIDLVEDLKIDHTFEEMELFTETTIMVKVTITNDKTKDENTLIELITVKKSAESDKETDKDGAGAENSTKNCVTETQEAPNDAIKIFGPQKGVKSGDKLEFSIKLNKPTKYIGYIVTARGSIIESDFKEVPKEDQTVSLKFDSTFQYVPRAFLLVYFVSDGDLYFDEKGFNLPKEFLYELKLKAPSNAISGSLVPIEIETTSHSLISLMAVDSNSFFLNNDYNLKYENFFDDIQKIRSCGVYLKGSGRYPGLDSGLVTLSNAKFDGFELEEEFLFFDGEHVDYMDRKEREDHMLYVKVDNIKKEIIRAKEEHEQVLGNLFFKDKESDKNGHLKFELKLPENPTTWLITAFASSDIKGFSMLKEPFQIKTIEGTKSEVDIETDIEELSKLNTPKIQSNILELNFDNYTNEIKKMYLTLETPSNSKILEISFNITESLFGPAIKHLNDHAGIMYDTGHLHMTTVIPNINVLEYLDHLKQLDSDFAMSIKERFPEAIQRELLGRRHNGSFSWFSNDPNGSPHMTSIVLQAFQRASKYVKVCQHIIETGLKYLVSQQLETGEIKKEEKPFINPFQENSSVGLTSMVLLAFLLDKKNKTKYSGFINKGFAYIIENLEAIDQVYDMALAFYAMQLARHPYALSLKTQIFEIAKTDTNKNQMWWPYYKNPERHAEDSVPVNELEITSYILLGLLETESIETLLPIIKWMLPITEFPNERMDRAIASDAILKMDIKCGAALGVMDVDFKAYAGDIVYENKIKSTPENSARILMHVLPPNTTKIEIATQNNGTFSGNITQRYQEI